jgi:hypothetical protein
MKHRKEASLENVLNLRLPGMCFIAVAVSISTITSMSALQAFHTNAEQIPRHTASRRTLKAPAGGRKGICVDSNVIAPQGLGDIVLRLRPAIIMSEILGATIHSPRVDTYHGYSTTEMLGLEPCGPAPVSRHCILTTEFDAHSMDSGVERYCSRGTEEQKKEWDSFANRVKKFKNCSNMHLSYKADYHITKTGCFSEWSRRLLRIRSPTGPKLRKSILFHRRGGDVEQGVGVEGDVWSPDDEKYRKALRQIKSYCKDVNVTMFTQTKNVTELDEYFGIEGMDIRNGGNITEVLSIATRYDVVLVGGGGFSALIVQAARPRLVIHYAKHGYDYDQWNDAKLGNDDLNSSTIAAACA